MTGEAFWQIRLVTAMNRGEAYTWGMEQLESYTSDARTDIYLLTERFLSFNRNDLLLHSEEAIDDSLYNEYKEAVWKRCLGVPVQYLTGKANFMGIDFNVNEHVLIPRFDTEILVEEVMKLGLSHMKLLDMCTGSGCILLSLLKFAHECTGVGVDVSPEALEVARGNAKMLGIEAEWIESDMFDSVPVERFDVIVSNPPYIRRADCENLMTEVKDYEPRIALDGGEDGLDYYRVLVSRAVDYLGSEGRLFMEIGYDQGEMVVSLMKEQGFTEVRIVKDYAGNDRVVTGIKI